MPIDWNIVDDEPPPAASEPSDALDKRRIHAIVTERRAAHQARLRAVLMPVVCAAVAAMAATRAWSLRQTQPLASAACVAIGLSAGWVGTRAFRRLPKSVVDRPVDNATPDFEALPDVRTPAERLTDLDR